MADGSIFLIRLLQLWMVHRNQVAWHPLAKTAYHILAGEQEEAMGEEEGGGVMGKKQMKIK